MALELGEREGGREGIERRQGWSVLGQDCRLRCAPPASGAARELLWVAAVDI